MSHYLLLVAHYLNEGLTWLALLGVLLCLIFGVQIEVGVPGHWAHVIVRITGLRYLWS